MHGCQQPLMTCFLYYLKSEKIMLRLDMEKPYTLRIVMQLFLIRSVDLCMYSFHMIRK